MRYFVRDKIFDMLPTFVEAIDYINNELYESANLVIEDLKSGLNSIRMTFNESFTAETSNEYDRIIAQMEQQLMYISEKKIKDQSTGEEVEEFKQQLNELEKKLKNESEVKLEILFIPYKYSMWDSLESIWLAAKDDPRCNARVMPIPYYDRDENGLLGEFHYEIEEYIKNDIPVVPYKDYDYTVIRPDIIYFHNPYDGNNRVTSVAPQFYSDKLKQHTDMLVYVPYFIAGSDTKVSINRNLLPGEINADKIITVSQVLTDRYIQEGLHSNKLCALGSPKIDYMVNNANKNLVPEKWRFKIKNKKIILLNSSIRRLLENDNYIKLLEETIDDILQKEDFMLIWRPHPLLESTIRSMRPNMLESFKRVKDNVQSKAILDTYNDFRYAIINSDAMISDHSSLARIYIATEKPLLFLEKSSNEESSTLPVNFYGSYFVNDGITIDDFLNIILNDMDDKKEIRLKKFASTVKNPNGNAGQKIHNYVTSGFC